MTKRIPELPGQARVDVSLRKGLCVINHADARQHCTTMRIMRAGSIRIGLTGRCPQTDCAVRWRRENVESTPVVKIARGRPSLLGVAAADRVLTVLTAFRSGDRFLQLTELANRTCLVKSTIMRLVISLEKYGLLARLGDGSYQLDVEVLRLGSVYQHSLDLASRVVPILEYLVDETGESASFYVRRSSRRLCLFRVDSPHLLRMHVYPGMSFPMDQSAIAKVLRAFGRGIDNAANIQVPVYTVGATDPHTASVATPVFRGDGALAGVLALSGPTTRLTTERLRTTGKLLSKAAQRLTKSLGGGSSAAVRTSVPERRLPRIR